MFVVYSVVISIYNIVNFCLSKIYIWFICNDSLSVYGVVLLEMIYIFSLYRLFIGEILFDVKF